MTWVTPCRVETGSQCVFPRRFPLLGAERADRGADQAMPAEGPRPVAGCAHAPRATLCAHSPFLTHKAQLLPTAAFLSILLHASLTSEVSMAMGLDCIKCLHRNITGNAGQQPLHEVEKTA